MHLVEMGFELKFLKTVVLLISVIGLSGCTPLGLSDSEKALCAKIGSNISAFQEQIVNLNRMHQSDPDWWVMLQGADSREVYLSSVKTNLPWVLDLPTGDQSKYGYFYNLIEAHAWQIASKGTEHEYVLTPAERAKLLADPDLKVDSFLSRPISDVFGPDNWACKPYDASLEDDPNRDELTDTWMKFVLLDSDIRDIVEESAVIRACQETGFYNGEKCAKRKYVGSDDPVETCTGKLSITVNSARYGDCGTLTFTIFQADANTGDYRALGWWIDQNGNEQVGMFMFGGLQEGSTYTHKVSVGTETTYTNSYGAEKTVLTFLEK